MMATGRTWVLAPSISVPDAGAARRTCLWEDAGIVITYWGIRHQAACEAMAPHDPIAADCSIPVFRHGVQGLDISGVWQASS